MKSESLRTSEASPWLPQDAAAPLIAWSDPQLHALAAVVGRALEDWRASWGIAPDATPVVCEAAVPGVLAGRDWQALGIAAWLGVSPSAQLQLSQLLFGTSGAASPVASDLVDACAGDARRHLAAALRLDEPPLARAFPPIGAGRAWSGAVHAVLPGAAGGSLLLGADAMQAWCRLAGVRAPQVAPRASREALCTAAEALQARRVPLTVELLGCELALGDLQSLQLGDVVRLPHALDAPAQLKDDRGQTVFSAFLVASDGRRAVELVKSQTH